MESDVFISFKFLRDGDDDGDDMFKQGFPSFVCNFWFNYAIQQFYETLPISMVSLANIAVTFECVFDFAFKIRQGWQTFNSFSSLYEVIAIH